MKKRRILVFAHVPPPHHGQSVMVQILLQGLSADPRFEVHHVDARVSDDLEDVGSFRPQKFGRLLKSILQAWWTRMRYGPMAFYYVPAPAKRSAIIRDWVVMALCRPLFPELILHWHAYGLGEWAREGRDWQRTLMRTALGKADLSIVLNDYNKRDAEVFAPKRIEVVPNGIPDLFPDYEAALAPKREARAAQLRELGRRAALKGEKHPNVFKNVRMSSEGSRGGLSGSHGVAESSEQQKEFEGGNRAERGRLERSDSRAADSTAGEINLANCESANVGRLERVRFLFLGHLIETKGVFVAIEATGLANEDLRKSNAPWRAHLTLAGSFTSEEEKVRVLDSIEQANKVAGDDGPCVTLAGFLNSGQKKAALVEADCLLFPTFYGGEAQPLVLLEAMCAGLSVITTTWHGIAATLPLNYSFVVEPRSVNLIVQIMIGLSVGLNANLLREKYENEYKLDLFSPRMKEILINKKHGS